MGQYLDQSSLEIRSAIEDMKTQLAEKFDLVELKFDSEPSPLDSLNFNGEEAVITPYSGILTDQLRPDNLAATLLLSDGNINKGININGLVRNSPSPIYTLGVGDTTTKKDLLIKNS